MVVLLTGFVAVLGVIGLLGLHLSSESKHVSDAWPPSILK